jgi:hypothetical protein
MLTLTDVPSLIEDWDAFQCGTIFLFIEKNVMRIFYFSVGKYGKLFAGFGMMG